MLYFQLYMAKKHKNDTFAIAREKIGKIFENFPPEKHDILLDILNLDSSKKAAFRQILSQIEGLTIKQKIEVVRFLILSLIIEVDKTNRSDYELNNIFLGLADQIEMMADDYMLFDDDESGNFYDDNDEDEESDSYVKYKDIPDVKKYTLRITLKHTNFKVWRKIEVPSNITLRCLGEVIIDAMGWQNAHLWQFVEKDNFYTPKHQMENDMLPMLAENRKADDFSLSEVMTKNGKTINFQYDFGDDWEHEVRLSSINDYKKDEEQKINLIDGENACPPEDCGGVYGYEAICQCFLEGPFKRRRKRQTDDDYYSYYLKDLRYNPFLFSKEETAEYIDIMYNYEDSEGDDII